MANNPVIPSWPGITDPRHRGERGQALADAARDADWSRVFRLLDEEPEGVNWPRPGGASWYAPLHQAAWHGAPADVAEGLVSRGAWRMLRTARGERALEVAQRREHSHLVSVLTPKVRHEVSLPLLLALQRRFHDLIRDRASDDLLRRHRLRLPELEPLLELSEPVMWFRALGTGGLFRFHLEGEGDRTRLIVGSGSRFVEGSEQRHEITAAGVKLVWREELQSSVLRRL